MTGPPILDRVPPLQQSRLPEFDFIRTLAIFGVVWIHISGLFIDRVPYGSIEYWGFIALNQLQRFCVPAFILSSGFFLAYFPKNSVRIDRTLIGRLQRVILPYLFWSILVEIYYAAFDLKERSISQVIANFVLGRSLYTYYFIVIIVQFYVIWWLLNRLKIKNSIQLLAMSLCIQLGFTIIRYAASFEIVPPLHHLSDRLVFDWIFYFFLGWFIGERYDRFRQFATKYRQLFAIVAVLAFAFSCLECYFIDVVWSDFDFSRSFYKLSSQIYAIACFFMFLNWSRSSSSIEQIARFSFAIYLTHAISIENFSLWLPYTILNSSFLAFLVMFTCVWSTTYGIVYVLNCTLPKPASKYLLGI
ncbi:MAG: acyltransferase [Cyanobacteria bacterium SBC]|nr:acyltransferase [Cyanobacteria bacterium SBC]